MAEYLIKGESLSNIADKVRELSGVTGSLSFDEMTTKIDDANASMESVFNALASKGIEIPDGANIGDIAEKIDSIDIQEYIVEVTVDSGATVTVTNGIKTYTGTSNGVCTIKVNEVGSWTCSATLDGAESTTRVVDVTNDFATTLMFFTAPVAVNTSEGAIVTAVKDNITFTQTVPSSGVANFTIRDPGDWVFTVTKDGKTLSETVSIMVAQDYNVYLAIDMLTLNSNSWEKIREISDAGTGRNYWSVGDCKAVHLLGTMGTLALDTTLWVYILGFDHNKDVEGSGIQFGGFKTDSGPSGLDVCLVDANYNKAKTDGTITFNINHWGGYTYGGWAGSDIRYDILGSTDVAPKGYGASKTSSTVGYDATTTCATTPVANTLMSCLPAELRAVMKPITKWTNNVGDSGDKESKVTAMIDYLPLLAEFEIFGKCTKASSYEQNHQVQYEYFSAGNYKKKYGHSATTSFVNWWGRSTGVLVRNRFTYVSGDYGSAEEKSISNTHGVAPAFMV